MKEGWRYEKLDDLGTIVTGATPSTNDESNYFPKEYCFVKPSDLPINGVGSIHETENYVSSKGLSVSRPLPAGSVLTTCIGTIGKVGLLLQEGCTNQQINAVIPNNKINSRYLAYALLSIRKQLEFIANAPVVPIINKKCFSKIHIGYPPKPSQLSIVSELDKLNELIQIKKEQLKDYDALAQSIFYEMFGDPVENEKGWKVKKLGELCSKIGSGATPRGGNESYKDEGISLIRSLNVYNNEFRRKDLAYIDDEQAAALSNVTILEDDVLLNITGASVARCCIVPSDLLPARVNQHVCIIRPLDNVLVPIFLNKVLTNISYQIRLLALARSKGATREALPKSVVDSLLIPLPPLPLQHSFAQKIEQIEQQKAAIQKTITDLESLLAARMQYWFD